MKKSAIYLAVLFTTLSVTACGPKAPSHRKSMMEPELEPIVAMFESDTGLNVDGIDFVFESLELPTIAQCEIFTQDGYRQKTIKVDPTYWLKEEISDQEKMGIIYHELGHCLLFRDHVESTFDYALDPHRVIKAPSSLMYPYSFYSKTFEPLRQYYVEELVHPERAQ